MRTVPCDEPTPFDDYEISPCRRFEEPDQAGSVLL